MSNARGFVAGAGVGLLAAVLVLGTIALTSSIVGGQPGASLGTQLSRPSMAGSAGGSSATPQPQPRTAQTASPSSIVMLLGESPYTLGWVVLPLLLAIALGAAFYQFHSRGTDRD